MGTKDARRRGYIEARPNGTFRAVVFAGTDALTDHDRYIKRTAPTRREAEKLLAKLQNEVDERRHSQASITLTQAIDQWLEVARHEASTRERYDELIRLYLTPVLGKRQLVEMDPQTLERLYSRLQDCRRLCDPKSRTCRPCEPLAPNTVRKIHFIVSAAMDRAVRYRQISVNSAALADPPRFARSEPDPPTAAEVAALLNEASRDPEWALLLILTLSVGWRRGEICALRWSDIDLETGTVTIDRSQWGRLEKSTKTNQQRRVAIAATAVEELRLHQERCRADCAKLDLRLTPECYVFSTAPDRRTPMLPRSISQRYRRLAETVGLRSTRLHALRHFSASQLVTAGVDVRTVAGRLGHGSGGATTLRTYAAWSTEADRRAATTIAGIVPVPDPSKREPRAAYELLAAQLAVDIEAGNLKPGTPLPTLIQLAAAYNLAPNTAHRAIRVLAERGLVNVSPGQRTVVASGTPQIIAAGPGSSSARSATTCGYPIVAGSMRWPGRPASERL